MNLEKMTIDELESLGAEYTAQRAELRNKQLELRKVIDKKVVEIVTLNKISKMSDAEKELLRKAL